MRQLAVVPTQRVTLFHTETVLFIDHNHAKVAEGDRIRKQGVSTDHSRSMRWPPGSGGIASRTLRPAGQSAPASLSRSRREGDEKVVEGVDDERSEVMNAPKKWKAAVIDGVVHQPSIRIEYEV